MGLGCLLSLAISSRAWADEGSGTSASSAEPEPEELEPAPQRIPGAITNEPAQTDRLLIPPYMRDRRGNVTTTAFFPFYFERRAPGSLERFVVPYYYRRGPQLNVDVALGLVWWLRGPERNTFVLPPFYSHRNGKDRALGLPPLFMTGRGKDHHYTLIPPLLTWIDGDAKNYRAIVGPYFYWKNERARWAGLFPLVWDKKDDVDRFTIVPPVFFRFADDDPLKATTVVPPFYYRREQDHTSWGLVPLVFHNEEPKIKSTTVPLALFHHATGPETFRLVNPVLSYTKSKEKGTLWVSPIYQRKRGDKNMDAVAPLFFRTWDNRDASSGLVIAPIFWRFRDPANESLVILPVFGRWHREGVSSTWVTPLTGRYRSLERDAESWWVFPTFHYAWDEDSWKFNIHPIVYRKESTKKSYLAFAPFYFDFRNHEAQTHRFTLFPIFWNYKNFPKQKRTTIAFPLWFDVENAQKQTHRKVFFPFWWDFEDKPTNRSTKVAFPFYARWSRGETVRHLVLNSFYETSREGKNTRWQYHFFPLLSVGGGEREKWWSFLYGLAGYERRGEYRRIQALWLPFELKK